MGAHGGHGLPYYCHKENRSQDLESLRYPGRLRGKQEDGWRGLEQ